MGRWLGQRGLRIMGNSRGAFGGEGREGGREGGLGGRRVKSRGCDCGGGQWALPITTPSFDRIMETKTHENIITITMVHLEEEGLPPREGGRMVGPAVGGGCRGGLGSHHTLF